MAGRMALRQRQQGRDAAQLARRRRADRSSMRSASASTRARRASPCIRAPTHGTSAAPTCATSPRCCAPLRAGVEFNIEGDPRPDLLELVARDPPAPVHARARDAPARSRARPGGRADSRPAICDRRSPASQARGVRVSLFVDADEAPGALGGGSMGAARSSYTTRAVRARFKLGPEAARRSLHAMPRAADLCPRCWASASTPGHDLDLGQPDALPHAAASRRSLDRPRADLTPLTSVLRPRRPRLSDGVPRIAETAEETEDTEKQTTEPPRDTEQIGDEGSDI